MRFSKESLINASAERVFGFHEQPDVLQRLIPPWETARVIRQARISEVGSETIIETRVAVIPIKWIARHTAYDPPRMFEDTQIKGPFRSWRHRHIVEPRNAGAVLRDEIEYELPLGILGRLVSSIIKRRLEKLFAYRHEITRQWCEKELPKN